MESLLKTILFDPTLGKIVVALLAVLLVVIVVRLAQRALGRYIQDSDRRYRMRKMVTFFGYLLAVFTLTLVFSDKLSSLTVAFGVTGAGIAFALQEVIVSVAGWVAMSFGRLYRIGDRIQLGGIKGDVIDIGVLRTTLMECGGWIAGDQYNGRIVRVANSFIFKEPVFNYSADFPFLWDEIIMPVRYGSDYTLARSIFQEVLEEVTGDYASRSKAVWSQMTEKYRIEDLKVEPVVTLVTNDNWVEYTLRYVVDYKKRRTTKDMICERVLQRIEREEGRVKLGSATFELTSLPDLDVRILPSAGNFSKENNKK
ncbi:MAG: mechanosensitive ion channel [Deltaproteobacteria bacterium]|nr:mechanosensitive ion channel [Deltaproteobacteria bacterium]